MTVLKVLGSSLIVGAQYRVVSPIEVAPPQGETKNDKGEVSRKADQDWCVCRAFAVILRQAKTPSGKIITEPVSITMKSRVPLEVGATYLCETNEDELGAGVPWVHILSAQKISPAPTTNGESK